LPLGVQGGGPGPTAVEPWERMAEWYDLKQGDSGDLWHRDLIDPGLLKVLGPVRGLRVLDLACGNGYLARRFAREGARVVGVDASTPVIERAMARERAEPLGVEYRVADATRLSAFESGRFDRVASNMAIMDIEDAAGAIREAARVLRPEGRLVFSMSHPCFDVMSRSMWVVEHQSYEETVWRKVRCYRETYEEDVPWRLESGRVARTRGYHRPLAWYFSTLASSGFRVDAFEEPAPGPDMMRESPQGKWIAEIPLHCVIGAVKSAPSSPSR
jgi:ubiquinone/menaquinone biosynthesis C-methylase UbiE